MRGARASVLRGALLTASYFAAGVLAVLYLRTPADVGLFWPAAGIGYALVFKFGLRHVVAIALAQALLHLLVIPAPGAFLPFSIASNAVGTLAACAYVRSRMPSQQIRIDTGVLLLRGGLLLALVSATIGAAGMLHAGMIATDDAPRALLQWFFGDLLGITAIAPSLLFLVNPERRRELARIPVDGSAREVGAWLLLALALAAVCVVVVGRGTLYPLAIANLAVALLMWSAARFPPLFTALATAVTSVLLALALGLGWGGMTRPESLTDTSLLMATLVVCSVVPSLLMASYSERFSAMAELHLRATRDLLTGLLNRGAFDDAARQRLATSTQTETLLYVDIDHFKLINDAASHAAGDEALRQLASLVRAEFPDHALVAHTGGDEFMVLATLSPAEAATRGRRLLLAIEASRVAWQGGNLRTTASIGVAASTTPHISFDVLLSRADTACHEAKERGGNGLVLAGTNAEHLHRRSDLMRSALAAREALDQRRFELFCQPIVDLAQPTLPQSHFEVLMRWRDADGNLHAPFELIAAAERYRLGPRLDRYVLDATLAWLEDHREVTQRIRHCNINLGAATLVDDDFGDHLAHRLRRSVLRPDQLCLEITETSVVRDMARARQFIARMRGRGCRFALDDFGTGFCSFSYLRDLDVDYLKIDGNFVRDLEDSALSQSVVRSIVEIAHLLGMRAVAEQVETEAQLSRLRALGVDYGQGYHFQRPLPIAEFFALAV